MTKEEFEKGYEGVIPEGKFCQYTIPMAEANGDSMTGADTSHDMSVVNGKDRSPFGHFKHAHYAGYVEDLINAYRNGDLIWKEDQ